MENSLVKKGRGGKREGAGRRGIGSTRQVKLTLPDEAWEWIDECVANKHADSKSEFLRNLIEYQRTGMKI